MESAFGWEKIPVEAKVVASWLQVLLLPPPPFCISLQKDKEKSQGWGGTRMPR